jgi:hypothetical protein
MFIVRSAETHLHIQVFCVRCGVRNLLRHEMLLQDHVYLRDPASGSRAVGVLCIACKHACMYTDPTEKYLPDVGGFFPPQSWRCFLISLWCEEPLCGIPLKIFAQRIVDTTSKELQAEFAEWTFADIVCPKGHTLSVKRLPLVVD